MGAYYALVDAAPGREGEVEEALRGQPKVRSTRVKEKSHDFLIRFEADSFGVVDDFLQTHIRQLRGVHGVEVISDWDDYGSAVREARARVD